MKTKFNLSNGHIYFYVYY